MSSSRLNTTNPDHLTYTAGMLDITVLGGIRLEGLDRMRATLKVQVEHLALRHNLDLYNDTQVEKLIRKVAEKLEIGTSVTAAALNDLTNQLEQYRLEEIERTEQEQNATYQLTESERKEALSFLQTNNLLLATNHLIGESGVIGEETNRLLMYLIFTSRKREQPLHIVSLGASGSGKTHLQEKVGELIPEEDKLEVTTLSENAFYYFGQRQLQNKLILIEDLDGAESVLYPLRELQSKKKISKTVVHKSTKGETKSINLTVEGPVSVAGCTTKERIYEDNANRSFLIYLDESREQDEKIMEYQRKVSAGKINLETQQLATNQLKNVQRVLQPIKVVNPYAELLQLPPEVFKPRRTNQHYLQFIEAVTFYHQKQREEKADTQTGEIYIETTLEDIRNANQLLKEVLLRKSDELSGACRNYFEKLKSYIKNRNANKACHPELVEGKGFTNREIRAALRIAGTTLRRHQNELLSTGRIAIKEGKKATGYIYQLIEAEEYEKLKENISSVLDEMLQKVEEAACVPEQKQRQASTPVVSQSKNGSGKNQKISKKAKASQ